MKDKYFEAICILSEILLERSNELSWKDTQLEMRDKEIDKLRTKVEYLEGFIGDDANRNDN